MDRVGHLTLLRLSAAALLCLPAGSPARPGVDATIPLLEPTPLAAPREIARRFGWSAEELERWGGRSAPRDLARESFALHEPPAGDPSCPPGLLVWISPGRDGAAPGSWRPVLDRHNLAWIGANDAGNSRAVLARFALALTAAENLKARGGIDPRRVYVGGMSGGARCASELAILYPEIFAGGFYIVGCSYFRNVPDLAHPGSHWNADFSPPGRDTLELARSHPYVFLTGGRDFNREEVRAVYESYRRDSFAHATYLEVPGMPHALPDAGWFEKGLRALEGASGESNRSQRSQASGSEAFWRSRTSK